MQRQEYGTYQRAEAGWCPINPLYVPDAGNWWYGGQLILLGHYRRNSGVKTREKQNTSTSAGWVFWLNTAITRMGVCLISIALEYFLA